MRTLVIKRKVTVFGMFIMFFLVTSCAQTTYVYQNGTTYNDYEVATNYRIKNSTKKPRVQTSKMPNWKKVQNKYRYN